MDLTAGAVNSVMSAYKYAEKHNTESIAIKNQKGVCSVGQSVREFSVS